MVTNRVTSRVRERVTTGIGRVTAPAVDEGETVEEAPTTQLGAERQLGEQARRAVERYLRERDRLVPEAEDEAAIRRLLATLVQEFQRRQANVEDGLLLGDPEATIGRLVDATLGMGILEPLMRDPTIEEIAVNGPRRVWVYRHERWEHLQEVRFAGEAEVLALIKRVVGRLNARLDESSPRVELRLVDGSRLSAAIPPVAITGSSLTIRKHRLKNQSLDTLIALGMLPHEAARFLEAALHAGVNILISGGTSAGKTTLMNALGASFATLNVRVVTIEDRAELQLPKLLQNAVALQGREANVEGEGEITIRDLVRTSLRMDPDRLIVGEVRGAEALDLLLCLNSGHSGSMSTIHANTPADALSKLITLARMAPEQLPRDVLTEMVASTIGLVVQLGRHPRTKVRRVVHIYEVTGTDGGKLLGQDLWTVREGRLERTTIVPRALATIAAGDVDYDLPPPAVPEGQA